MAAGARLRFLFAGPIRGRCNGFEGLGGQTLSETSKRNVDF